jgi:hypothetical protein
MPFSISGFGEPPASAGAETEQDLIDQIVQIATGGAPTPIPPAYTTRQQILGVLGDTLMALGGGQPMFGPMRLQRERERREAQIQEAERQRAGRLLGAQLGLESARERSREARQQAIVERAEAREQAIAERARAEREAQIAGERSFAEKQNELTYGRELARAAASQGADVPPELHESLIRGDPEAFDEALALIGKRSRSLAIEGDGRRGVSPAAKPASDELMASRQAIAGARRQIAAALRARDKRTYDAALAEAEAILDDARILLGADNPEYHEVLRAYRDEILSLQWPRPPGATASRRRAGGRLPEELRRGTFKQ